MPTISADFTYGLDFLNFTVTQSQGAPKVKPAWKVRTAPKLPPKQQALPASSTARPATRPKINASRFPNRSDEKATPRIQDITETDKEDQEPSLSNPTNSVQKPTGSTSKKNPPKLKATGAAKTKTSPTAAKTPKTPNNTTKPQVNGAQ
jgi:hypothetical protein